jgi:isocitrate dehydrogenase
MKINELQNPNLHSIEKSCNMATVMVDQTRGAVMAPRPVRTKITVAEGDGIGPEIMKATLDILEAAGADLDIETVSLGEQIYLSGVTSGIPDDAWQSIRTNKVLLKGPVTTPQGKGFKSVNVTIRKAFGLYANIRPCKAYHPFVASRFPDMDLVIIRENEEDLYAGIEHQHTDEVIQCLKLISRPGCEKIIRYAFEYARKNQRKQVTCLTKDNIMKQTDGLFHQVFNEVALEYPEITISHQIIDIGTARLADAPQSFDVIVTLNLYGDIISDVAAQVSGSVGLAGSANIGNGLAMFEAIHGSAPDIAGQNIANPSGLIQAAVMMLRHIGQSAVAEKIQNAWLCTLEEGIHTVDVFREGVSKHRVGTAAFAEAVIERLGSTPQYFPSADFAADTTVELPPYQRRLAARKDLVGTDIFVDWKGKDPVLLAKSLQIAETAHLRLKMITNRGVKVWPGGLEETFLTDHWRCRFQTTGDVPIFFAELVALLQNIAGVGMEVVKMENLYLYDGKQGFSMGQGQ